MSLWYIDYNGVEDAIIAKSMEEAIRQYRKIHDVDELDDASEIYVQYMYEV